MREGAADMRRSFGMSHVICLITERIIGRLALLYLAAMAQATQRTPQNSVTVAS